MNSLPVDNSNDSDLKFLETQYCRKKMIIIWSIAVMLGIGSLVLFDSFIVLCSLIALVSVITLSQLRHQNMIYVNFGYVTHRDLVKDQKDGCAKYDDLWGGN
ncbi:MAG: hypothetical protein MK137_10270 [Rickettsiales bacterium]|nr:hypothetical protein [Rickettsiales bacterium]